MDSILYDTWKGLTLVVVVLIVSSAVQHTEDLEDIAVAIVAMEFVASPVEAQNELSRPPAEFDILAIPSRRFWDIAARLGTCRG